MNEQSMTLDEVLDRYPDQRYHYALPELDTIGFRRKRLYHWYKEVNGKYYYVTNSSTDLFSDKRVVAGREPWWWKLKRMFNRSRA